MIESNISWLRDICQYSNLYANKKNKEEEEGKTMLA